MTTPRESRHTLPGIQLLRGLTACLVVLAHANLIMGHKEEYGAVLLPIHLGGMFAVCVFFVISGFIIAAVSLDSRWQPRLSTSAYFTKRFIRIVPFMWLSIIGYNLLSLAATRQMEWLPFLRAMTLWPIGELKPNIIWSLQHEALFYMLFALSFLGARRRPWLLALWFVAPLAYAGLLGHTGSAGLPSAPWLRDLASLVLLGGFSGANAQFAVGFLLGLYYLRRAPDASGQGPALNALAITALLAIATAFVEWSSFPIGGMGRIIIWTLLAGALVWLGIGMRFPAQRSPIFRLAMLLGDASFSIYLVHSATLMILFFLARRGASLAYAVPGLTLVAIFIAAVATGIAAHLLIERPLIAWLAGGRRVTVWQKTGDATA